MGLKSLMETLKRRGAVTAVTSGNSATLQRKAPIHAGCTAVTAVTSNLNDARANALFGQFGEAVNDPASTEPPMQDKPQAPAIDLPDWRELDRAYQSHHFKCSTCIAAGLGYGLRCGVGAALWTTYSAAT
ncbi:MAG: hypothetical protein ABIR56_18885 [Polaromonas sp.]